MLFFTTVFCRFCVNKVLLYPVPKTIMLLLCFHFSEIQLQGNSAKETNKLCKKLLTYLPLFPDFSTNKVSSETKSTDLNFPKVFCDCFFTNLFLFLTFPACFSIPIIFSNLDFNCSNLSSLRNLQEQVKKAFCYQELF